MQHLGRTGIPLAVRRARLMLVAVAGLLAASMLDQQLMDSDPAQYATVAQHIASSGDWLVLTDMNGPFINKPPLMMQAQAVGLLVLGRSSSAGARLPALAFFLLTVVGTWWLGSLLRGPDFGLDAAVLVACSVALHHMVADPKVDLALTAMVTWAVACFVAGVRRAPFTIGGWAFMALAVLAKGPVGLFLVVGAVGVALVRRRSPGPRWWLLHGLGALLFVALVSPFYAAMARCCGGQGTLLYLLWEQGPGRLVPGGGEFHDTTTPLYVLHTAAWALLPMSPVLGWALVGWARARLRGAPRPPPGLEAVAGWWLVTSLLAVALASFRLPQYVYWAAPAAALVAARALEGLPRWVPVAVASLAGGLGVLVVLVMFPPGPVMGAVVLAGLCAAVVVSARRSSPALALGASTLGFVALFDVWLHPALLEYQPSRAIASALAPTGAKRVQLVDVARTFSLDFYLQRALPELAEGDLQPGYALVSEAVAQRLGTRGRVLGTWPSYRVSLPRWPFLRAQTRAGAVQTVTLVEVAPR